MASVRPVEQFVTLFDSNYLPMGLCLHASLMQHAKPFHLWVLCIDELVEEQLRRLALPHVSLISLRYVETPSLLAVKDGRTRAEYCWTLTPFIPQFVFESDPAIDQVTYVDADVYFLDSPQVLLGEFAASGKDVLITRHGYAPEYDQSATSGTYCVQFMAFRKSVGGLRVMQWWQERCLEWCFYKFEDGKIGDQGYLEDWPERFSQEVHVLQQVEKTLGPWNVRHFISRLPQLKPVMYHFHSLRIVSPNSILLRSGYQVGGGSAIYERYLDAMRAAFEVMRSHGIEVPFRPLEPENWHILRQIRHAFLGTRKFAEIH